jgi:uncharacterized membrane protein YfcA
MGYGVTSTSLLLTLGLTPAIASASVHLAEIGTSGVSGFSHWRLGNVNWRVLVLLAIPGGVGAFLGAVVLSNLAIDAARPLVSLILLVLGGTILFRFLHERRVAAQIEEATRSANEETDVAQPAGRARPWMLVPLGLVGGFLDASGGGGWGPVTTSTMMAASRMRPRTIIGTVSGSEFIVAIAASTGFLLALGTAGIDPMLVAMLLLGGAIAAPLAAYLVTRFSDRSLGTAVGGLIIFLNLDRAAVLFGLDPTVAFALRLIVAAVTVLVVAGLIVRGVSRRRSAAGSAA